MRSLKRATSLLAVPMMAAAVCSPVAAQTTSQTAASADQSLIEMMAAELRAMRARIESLESEVTTLRSREAAPAAQATTNAAPMPVWEDGASGKGDAKVASVTSRTGDDAPLETSRRPLGSLDLDRGRFPIETFGQIQYDFSNVSNPGDRINTTNLGYNGTARRLIFGFRGGLPGDFRYNLEFMLAREIVDYEDVTLSWEPQGKPYSIKIGNHYPFTGLENLTSNKRNSFLERSQANDAFNFNRRIGISAGYVNKREDIFLNAGVFNGFINNSAANTEYVIAGRGIYAPQVFGGRIHLGGSYQYRRTPAQDQTFLYRARPFTQGTNIRFIGTGPATSTGAFSPGIATRGDQVFSTEVAGIFGPVHFVSEFNYVPVSAIKPGDILTNRRTTTGTRLASNPEFFAIYGEVGYFLTGETRGYRLGRFFRTPIRKPVTEGGIGAIQIVGRVDYLDLSDIVGGSGPGIVNGVLNGGIQTGYQVALNWYPTDFLRFSAQYSRIEVEGGPNAGQVDPLSTDPLFSRNFGSDAVVLRAQIEF